MLEKESQSETRLLPVEALALKIQAHWKEHAPQKYKELASEGQLRSLSLLKAQRTHRFDQWLRNSGLDRHQACSQAMREVALQ